MKLQYMDGTIVNGSTPYDVLVNLAGAWLPDKATVIDHYRTTLSVMGLDVGTSPNAASILTLMINEGIISEVK